MSSHAEEQRRQAAALHISSQNPLKTKTLDAFALGIKYRDFCTDYRAKCEAMIRCADDFDLDWVTVISDVYCEASAFGLQIEYPEDSLPIDAGGHLPDLAAVARLMPIKPQEHLRCVIACTQVENRQKPGVKLGGKRKAAGAARADEAGGGLCRG